MQPWLSCRSSILFCPFDDSPQSIIEKPLKYKHAIALTYRYDYNEITLELCVFEEFA